MNKGRCHMNGTCLLLYVFPHPPLFANSSIAREKISHGANVVNKGSPSRIRMVRRISLGMTTRPRSSIRRTIPVAFILYLYPPVVNFVSNRIYYPQKRETYASGRILENQGGVFGCQGKRIGIRFYNLPASHTSDLRQGKNYTTINKTHDKEMSL